MTPTPPPHLHPAAPPRSLGTGASTRWAALTALGIVYGDLGTSPLYTLQTVVEAAGGRLSAADALGVLSLVFWLPMTMRRRRTTYERGPGYTQREDVETY